MALKGSAVIELTNPDGSKEVIKHDNMITNAASDYLKSYGGEMPPIMKIANNGDSFMKLLFGGILLFDETLNNDPDDYFLPSLKVTGYASQGAYEGSDVSKGSFNAAESGLQEDGKSYKFVWDFATSQGNGSIKSIGLCPQRMGQIGITSTKDSSLTQNFFQRDITDPFLTKGYKLNSDDNSELDGDSCTAIHTLGIIDDIAYAVSINNIGWSGGSVSKNKWIGNNGWILKLYRMKLGVKNVSSINAVGKARLLDPIDIQLPTDFTSTLVTSGYSQTVGCRFSKESKKIYVFPNQKGNVQVNGTIKYCEIDLSNNYSISTYTFTNNTAGTIINGTNRDDFYNFLVFNDEYIFSVARKSDGKNCMYISKKNDNTQVKEVKNADGTPYEVSNANVSLFYICPKFWSEKIAIIEVANYNSMAYGEPYFAVDLSTGEAKNLYARQFSLSDVTANDTYFGSADIGSKVIFAYVGKSARFWQAVNPFVLTTKNNLDSPVTKTSSQTMKITYTLTESEG